MIYYVSNSGSDLADGMSPETAWRSVEKVNVAADSGDEVRFRRGDTFYGTVRPKPGYGAEHPTVLTAWGEGARPVISQYKLIDPLAWEQFAPNVYRVKLRDSKLIGGNTTSPDSNVGFIMASGKLYYRKATQLSQLSETFDFYSDNKAGEVYVYASEHPALLSDDIRLACNIGSIAFADHIEVRGLEIRGTGSHGISGVTAGAVISDCYIHEIGGSELPGYVRPDVRYGNGVETWSNSHDVTIENCEFSDIYDVAITMQGNHATRSWENMTFRNNRFWDCTQCLEIWSESFDPSVGFVKCKFESNTCLFSGQGWGYDARPDKSVGAPLLIYNLHGDTVDVQVTNNLFVGYGTALIFKAGGAAAMPGGYCISGNTVIREPGKPLIYPDNRDTDEVVRKFEEKLIADNKIIERLEY